MSDIMWSDPSENSKGWNLSPRGAGFVFGKDVFDKFLHQNSMQILIRSH